MTRAAGIVRIALLVLLAVFPTAAEPHASLVRSSPGPRALVPDSPRRVDLWFSERLESAYSTVSVWNVDGKRMDRQDVLVGPDDSKRLSVGLFTLRPGAYTVRYRVLSVDGHAIDSSYTFTVKLPSSG